MTPPRSRSFAAEALWILLAALAAGMIEAALIYSHSATAVDPFHYVPWRVWLWVPLAWVAIATGLAVCAYAVSSQRGAGIVLCAIPTFLIACRIAPFSRKWAACVLLAVGLTLLWLTRRVSLWYPRHPGALLGALLVAILCAAALTMARRPAPLPKPAVDGPNVLVIFLDTVRYDALFLRDGRVKRELPSLARLVSEATVYDAAYAASSWTLPSHFAAVTGLDAHLLGLDFDHQTFEKPVSTLAERFRRKGYRTAAVLANPFLHDRSGFARGFDSFEHADRELDLCRTAPLIILSQVWPRFAGTVCGWSSTQVMHRALQHMTDDGAPYFVLLNLMDAHDPSYLEPDCRAGVAPRHNTFLRLRPREPHLYHAAIRCMDKRLGALFDRASSSRRGTIVVVTSDHGEHLHERGLVGHGQTLYREVLHVPLMIRRPGRDHERIATPVSLTSLGSLLSETTDRGAAAPPFVTSTLVHCSRRGRRRDVSVIRGPWQLITAEGKKEELIDLRTENAVEVSPLLLQLRADTGAVQRAWPRVDAGPFRSVGYIQ